MSQAVCAFFHILLIIAGVIASRKVGRVERAIEFPYPSDCGSHCKPGAVATGIGVFVFPYPSDCGSHCKVIDADELQKKEEDVSIPF
jgi:hypothetical protein